MNQDSSNHSAATARAIISTIGHDRPGLVSELSGLITRLGLSIEDSRMTVLGGEFAVLMSVVGESTLIARLETALASLAEGQDLAYLVRTTSTRAASASRPYRARIVAMDHPGIVQGVADFFSRRHINIRNLETETQRAAHTGTAIFNLDIELEVPVDVRVRDLREAFDDYCSEQNLDGELAAGFGK